MKTASIIKKVVIWQKTDSGTIKNRFGLWRSINLRAIPHLSVKPHRYIFAENTMKGTLLALLIIAAVFVATVESGRRKFGKSKLVKGKANSH